MGNIHTKVRGVSAKNDNGTARQKFVKRCRPGQKLVLVRDADNPHDENAIKVCTKGSLFGRSRQLGFISADLAYDLAHDIDRGGKVSAVVDKVTGGGGLFWWKKQYGLNIVVTCP